MLKDERLEILDNSIRENKFPNWEKLGMRFTQKGEQVWRSKRTFESDIKTLKIKLAGRYPNIPEHHLKYSKQNAGFKYHPDVAGLSDFKKSEMKQAALHANELLNYSHLIASHTTRNLLERLNSYAKVVEFEQSNEKLPWKPVEFIEEGKRQGGAQFDIMLKAITDLQSIELEYLSYEKNTRTRRHVLPLLLKEWDNSWYVLVKEITTNFPVKFKLFNKDLRIFALNRIINAKESGCRFNNSIVNLTSFDPYDYWKNVYGISNPNLDPNADNKVYDIVLEIKGAWHYGYFLNTPIHPTKHILQKIPEKYLKMKISCKINVELISLILRFGPEIKVLKPKIMINQIKSRAAKILENYK